MNMERFLLVSFITFTQDNITSNKLSNDEIVIALEKIKDAIKEKQL